MADEPDPAAPPAAGIEPPAGAAAAVEADKRSEKNKRRMQTGVAVGIGSAAIVAALLYATRTKRNELDA